MSPQIITSRSCLVACLATLTAFLASTFVAAPWDIASTVVASVCGGAALLLFLVDRTRQPKLDTTRDF
jgi:hypothetical protein